MQSQRNSLVSTKFQIADLIGQLQRKEKPLKESIQKCDILFAKETIDNETKQICQQEVQKEQNHFLQYLQAFRALDDHTQKPYANTIRKYKVKVDRHKALGSRLKENIATHKQFIDEQKEIWQEEYERQSRLVFYGRGIMGVFGAFMLHLLIGAIYRWAMINGYITSYYKITNDPYIQTSTNSIGAPISMLAVGLTMKPSLKLSQKTGKVGLILVAVILLFVSAFLCSFMPSFLLFIFFHNFTYGLCSGMLFLTTMSQCQKYFSQWRLYINSLILVGTGLGGVLFGVLNLQCMNHETISPSQGGYYSGDLDYVAYRLPNCFRNMSYIMLCIGIVGWILIVPLLRYNARDIVIEHRIKTMKDFEFICHDENEALKSVVFWKIAAIVVLCSGGNFFMNMNYKNIPSSTIHNVRFLNIVVLSGAITNGLFRFVWGFSLQKAGFKWAFLFAMILNILCFSFTPIAIKYYYAYITVYAVSGAALGGVMVLMPNLCLLVFGELVGNQIFGYIWFFFTTANFIQYAIGATLTHQFPHSTLILIFAVTSLAALILSSLTRFQGRWENKLNKLTF